MTIHYSCIVKGCENDSKSGRIINHMLCSPCYSILTTGKPNPTNGILKEIGTIDKIKRILEKYDNDN